MVKPMSNTLPKRYNLRSSLFKDYAFGLKYKSAGQFYMSPTERAKRLQHDLNNTEPVMPDRALPYIEYGNKHEMSGIAKHILVNQEMCKDYGDNQQNYVIQDWLNLKEDVVVDISTTPDGLSMDDSRIIEVKCSKMGQGLYPEFPKQYLPQIAGQMMILNMLNIPVKQVDLVNWNPTESKIWTFERSADYEQYLIDNLEHYSLALLGKHELGKPTQYSGKLNINLVYGA
jgi:hypothetical protein